MVAMDAAADSLLQALVGLPVAQAAFGATVGALLPLEGSKARLQAIQAAARGAVQGIRAEDTAAPADEEFTARMDAIGTVIAEHIDAARSGRPPRLCGSQRAKRNVATHADFGAGPGVLAGSEAVIKRRQRGRRGNPTQPSESTSSPTQPSARDMPKDESAPLRFFYGADHAEDIHSVGVQTSRRLRHSRASQTQPSEETTSGDGSSVLTVSGDKTAKTFTGECTQTPRGPSAGFSGDGSSVLTASGDKIANTFAAGEVFPTVPAFPFCQKGAERFPGEASDPVVASDALSLGDSRNWADWSEKHVVSDSELSVEENDEIFIRGQLEQVFAESSGAELKELCQKNGLKGKGRVAATRARVIEFFTKALAEVKSEERRACLDCKA